MKWLVLALVLLPGAVWAADGDGCAVTGRSAQNGLETRCTLVCDSKVSTDTTCSDYVIRDPADTYAFEISNSTNCSGAASVTITNSGLSNTAEHTIATLDITGDTEAVVHGDAAQLLTYLHFDLSNMTGCSVAAGAEGFDVKMWRFTKLRD